MEANGVVWQYDDKPVVCIKEHGGVEGLLQPGAIEAELKASGLEALGVMVDADDDAHNQWIRIKSRCHNQFAELPEEIPTNGLILRSSDGPRFGVWIMPNNRFTGMLEDFLIQLVPDDCQNLYKLVERCVSKVADNGAPFRSVHRTKAELYTWLAWQDDPGKQLHQAVHHRVLDPGKPESQSFVKWFRALFSV